MQFVLYENKVSLSIVILEITIRINAEISNYKQNNTKLQNSCIHILKSISIKKSSTAKNSVQIKNFIIFTYKIKFVITLSLVDGLRSNYLIIIHLKNNAPKIATLKFKSQD